MPQNHSVPYKRYTRVAMRNSRLRKSECFVASRLPYVRPMSSNGVGDHVFPREQLLLRQWQNLGHRTERQLLLRRWASEHPLLDQLVVELCCTLALSGAPSAMRAKANGRTHQSILAKSHKSGWGSHRRGSFGMAIQRKGLCSFQASL